MMAHYMVIAAETLVEVVTYIDYAPLAYFDFAGKPAWMAEKMVGLYRCSCKKIPHY